MSNENILGLEGVVPNNIDELVDAKIEELLESPEIDAMLENVAADAADDAKLAQGQPFDPIAVTIPGWTNPAITGPSNYVTTKEFDEFKARVAAAFKHAGFKF